MLSGNIVYNIVWGGGSIDNIQVLNFEDNNIVLRKLDTSSPSAQSWNINLEDSVFEVLP